MSNVSFNPSAFSEEPDPTTVRLPETRTWSSQQIAVRDWVRNGRGNATLIAVAGSGKSTTLVNVVLPELTGWVDIAVFNKKAEIDLKGKAEKLIYDQTLLCRGLQIKTFHAFGLSAWGRANPKCLVEGHDDRRGKAAGYYKFDRIATELTIERPLQYFVKKLLSMMKQRALGVLAPSTSGMCRDIIEHFDLDMALYNDGKPGPKHDQLVDKGIEYAMKALVLNNTLSPEIVDTDDMLYAPLVGNIRMFQVDWLLVDEAQDSNPARRAFAKRMLRPGGRAIFVGDPHQAIQGFTGADNNSLEVIKQQFGCVELILSKSFRCPQSGVRLAQTWVSHIEAVETAPEGKVSTINRASFDKIDNFANTDAILCRKNAPLVDLAWSLIKKGIACHVEGRDIGLNLITLVEKWKIVHLPALRDKLETYKARETVKLMGKGHEAQADQLADRVDTIIALIDGMPAGALVTDLRSRITSMFQDSDGRKAQRLTLCSVHKAKGLEWPKVYLLGRNKFMPSPYARQQWQMEQEDNLCYVATTRHKEEIVEVNV